MDFKRTRLIQRGDIYYADLSPVTGSEQGGIRPVLILQNNVGNHHSPTVIAAAITGYVKGKRQPTHVRLKGAACFGTPLSCWSRSGLWTSPAWASIWAAWARTRCVRWMPR